MQRCRVGGRSDERVLVDLTAAAQRHPADVSNEHRRVHQLELSERRCRRLHPQTPRPAGPLERRLDRVDPLRRIRMLRQEHPRVMLTGRAVMEIQHLTHTTPLPHITPLARQHTDQHTSVSNASAAVRITAAVTYPPAERDANPNAWIHAHRGSSLGPVALPLGPSVASGMRTSRRWQPARCGPRRELRRRGASASPADGL